MRFGGGSGRCLSGERGSLHIYHIRHVCNIWRRPRQSGINVTERCFLNAIRGLKLLPEIIYCIRGKVTSLTLLTFGIQSFTCLHSQIKRCVGNSILFGDRFLKIRSATTDCAVPTTSLHRIEDNRSTCDRGVHYRTL